MPQAKRSVRGDPWPIIRNAGRAAVRLAAVRRRLNRRHRRDGPGGLDLWRESVSHHQGAQRRRSSCPLHLGALPAGGGGTEPPLFPHWSRVASILNDMKKPIVAAPLRAFTAMVFFRIPGCSGHRPERIHVYANALGLQSRSGSGTGGGNELYGFTGARGKREPARPPGPFCRRVPRHA